MVRTAGNHRRIPAYELERLLGTVPSEQEEFARHIVFYGRVSSHEQKKKGDLDRQIERLTKAFSGQPFSSAQVISDVGSGLNDRRKGLNRLLNMVEDKEVTDVAITFKDRLTRFGFHYLERYFKSHGVTLHVLDAQQKEKNVHAELVEDLLAIVTSFAGKLYGIRSAKNQSFQKNVKEMIARETDLPDEDI